MDQNTKDVLMLAIPTLAAVASGFTAYAVAKLKTNVNTVKDDVLRVEKATNSHTDLLVAATKAAAHADGKEQERVERRERDAAPVASPPELEKGGSTT